MSRYTRDEVEQILRKALDAQPVDELSHDELLDVAIEAGIDPELVESAANELASERVLDKQKARIVQRRKNQFLGNLWTFAAVNAPLMLVDLMSGPGWWVQYVMGGWGIALALMARRAYFPAKGDLDKRAAIQLSRKRRRKPAKRGESDLERAIDAGVRAMVDAAANKMSERERGYQQRSRHRRTQVSGAPDVPEVIDAEVVDEDRKRRRNR